MICGHRGCACGYLPPHIISKLLESDDPALRRTAYSTGRAEAAAHARRLERSGPIEGHVAFYVPGKGRAVFDMQGTELPKPGKLLRREGDAEVNDQTVDEAYAFAGVTYDFYQQVFSRASLDSQGYPLTASVRFGQGVANALWDGSQVLFGDGDGQYFLPFTRSLAIVAHEFTHGVVAFTSNLAYQGEPGALNESFCDVMSAQVVQWHGGKAVDEADWIIGREIVGPKLAVHGIRSFTAQPAYSGDPDLGDDPQPKHIRDYVVTADDYGGVHINSGIPNHAFYLAAMALGGHCWQGVGRIWYDGFRKLSTHATFKDAATATVLAARTNHGSDSAEQAAVEEAWKAVGVTPEV